MNTKTKSHPFYFEPDSVIWKINREQVLLLGGARALLMQIAHPLVAEAVYQHSYVFEQPLKRLHRTLDLTLGLVFGTTEEVMAAAEDYLTKHIVQQPDIWNKASQATRIIHPTTPVTRVWACGVYATLVEGAVHGYERFVYPLSDEEKHIYYEESKRTVELLGIKPQRLPATYGDLLNYMERVVAEGEVVVSERARQIAPFILGHWSPPMKLITYPTTRLTVGLLPDPIRQQYGYTFHPTEQKLLNIAQKTTRHLVPRLPSLIRYVPPYRRAQRLLNIR